MNAFEYHSPADLEREHYDHVEGARYDYYNEAYGAEARLIPRARAVARTAPVPVPPMRSK